MAKGPLEKALEKHQKEIERQVKKQIEADKKLADKQRRNSERQARIDARRERASSIVVGQPTVGDIRILIWLISRWNMEWKSSVSMEMIIIGNIS